jgi:hypothetical protein
VETSPDIERNFPVDIILYLFLYHSSNKNLEGRRSNQGGSESINLLPLSV